MNLNRHWRLAGAGVALALALTACGDEGGGGSEGGSGSELSGTLNGIGASSQTAAMQAWTAKFQEANPDVTINYDPQGSGAGREQFVAGAADFAGSDAYLDDEELTQAKERCGGAGAIDLPMYISPIAVIFNVPGATELNLKPEVISNIFQGKVTKWNDPSIKADNPSANLPDLAITPVHRQDDSGTTENFTDYLFKAGKGTWTEEPDGEWPLEGGEAANGTSGVIQSVTGGQGTIGYADASQAGELGKAKIQVGTQFVEYTPEGAAAVIEASTKVAGRGEYDLAYDIARDTTSASAYPIVLLSYHIACLQYDDAAKADAVKAFLTYVASTEGQQAAAESAGSAPISDTLRQSITTSIEQIKGAA